MSLSICSLNITIGLFVDKLVTSTKKKITGIYGSIFDEYFVVKEQRNCEFKRILWFMKEEAINEKQRNLTGVHLLETDQIDLNAFGQKVDYINEKLERTTVNSLNFYRVYQTLNPPDKLENYEVSTFLTKNFKDILTILTIYLAVNALFFILMKKKFRTVSFNIFSMSILNYDELSSFSFKNSLTSLLLSWNIFFWIYLSILSNDIKTDKIIVNTKEFLDTSEKLAKTSKTFFFYSLDEDIYRNLPTNSFLHRLYVKKVLQEKNFFRYYYLDESKENESKEFHSKNDLDSFFVLSKEGYLPAYFVFLLQYLGKDQFGFINNNIYYEYFTVNYFRKNLDKTTKKKLLKIQENYFEKQLLKHSIEVFRKLIEPRYKVFYDTKDYIDEYISTSAFSFKNYQKLFALLIFVYLILIVVFLIHLSKKKEETIAIEPYVNRFKRPILARLKQEALDIENKDKEDNNAVRQVTEIIG